MVNASIVTNLSRLSIRRATPADRAALEHIAGRTWAGADYLPSVLDEWLADPVGEFVVAVDQGVHGSEPETEQVLGTGKLTRIAEGEWWLEGLRVDPDLYQHGIGQTLHNYLLQRAESLGQPTGSNPSVVRFVTGPGISPVRKMALRSGFSLVSQWINYDANTKGDAAAIQRMAAHFRRLSVEDLPQVQAFLGSSRHFEQVQQSIFRANWHAEFITPTRLAAWLSATGENESPVIYAWHGQRKNPALIDGLVILELSEDNQHDGRLMDVDYLDAVPGNLAVMAQGVRCLAALLSCSSLHHMMLYRPERLVAIEQAGWRRPDDDSGRADLYSRPLGVGLHQVIDP